MGEMIMNLSNRAPEKSSALVGARVSHGAEKQRRQLKVCQGKWAFLQLGAQCLAVVFTPGYCQ